MNKPVQIGITGGIGAGKSTVSKVFRVLGVAVYNSDDRAKVLMTTDGKLVRAIEKEFGKLAYGKDGSLNRAFLGSTVFNSTERLQKLNQIVHPRVADDYSEWVREHEGEAYLVKEAALLVETGSFRELDKLILVVAPEGIRLRRILERDPQRTPADIKKIMMNQMPDKEKATLADYVLANDETELLLPQVLKLHELFMSMSH